MAMKLLALLVLATPALATNADCWNTDGSSTLAGAHKCSGEYWAEPNTNKFNYVSTAGATCAADPCTPNDYTGGPAPVGEARCCQRAPKWYKYECTATGAYRTVYKSQTKPASTATGGEILTASNACADANKHEHGKQAVSAAGGAGYYKCTTQNYGDYQWTTGTLFGDAAGTYKSLRNMCVAGKLQDQYFKTADCTGPGKLNDWGNTCTATPTVSAFTGTCGANFDCSGETTNKTPKSTDTVTADTVGTAAECCKAPLVPGKAPAPAGTSAAVRVTAGLAAVLALLAFAA